MGKKKLRAVWFAVIVILTIILIFVVGCFFFLGVERTKVVVSDLYVNNELMEEPAVIYWHGEQVCVSLPFFDTLKGLGCVLKEKGDDTVTIQAGNNIYLFQNKKLYSQNRELLVDDMDVQQAFIGSQAVSDQVYLQDYNYREILAQFGFDSLQVDIDGDHRIVSVNIIQG